jgi:hypothetical protein
VGGGAASMSFVAGPFYFLFPYPLLPWFGDVAGFWGLGVV